MFTGLVETQGTIASTGSDGYGGISLAIRESRIAPQLALGESVAVNGACLTVTKIEYDSFHFQVGPETVALTTFAQLKTGESVNLERSLRVGDRLGGHFVTGHIDGTGTIAQRERQGEWEMVEFAHDPAFDDLLVKKGSIAVDGVSLTVAECGSGRIRVMLIPHTLAETTLGRKGVGDTVNLEFDLLAKHIRGQMQNAEWRMKN